MRAKETKLMIGATRRWNRNGDMGMNVLLQQYAVMLEHRFLSNRVVLNVCIKLFFCFGLQLKHSRSQVLVIIPFV
eukprot:COSAG06_NODE_58855_length_276_cov_0.564972_1_plen_74_part_10